MKLTLNNSLIERLGAINVVIALSYFVAGGQMMAAALIMSISIVYLFLKPSFSFKLNADAKFQLASLLILFTFVFFSNVPAEDELPFNNSLSALFPSDISLTSLVQVVTIWVKKMITLL